ncbi:MAG: hypothetical protein PVJ57_23065 [Phycisphaerae bacterium]|jgi:hypothetical protein
MNRDQIERCRRVLVSLGVSTAPSVGVEGIVVALESAVELVEKRDLEGEPDELLLSLTDEPDPDDEPTLVSCTCGQCVDYRPGTCASPDVPDEIRARPRTGATRACVAYRSERREFLMRTCPYVPRKP